MRDKGVVTWIGLVIENLRADEGVIYPWVEEPYMKAYPGLGMPE